MEPRIQYAQTSDGVSIAFWTLGEGPAVVDLGTPPFSHIGMEWQLPEMRRWYERFAVHHQFVRFDGRGTGLSERNIAGYSIDGLVLDLEAVIERLKLDRVILFGAVNSGLAAITHAARQPQRISKLILWCAYSRGTEFFDDPGNKVLRDVVERDWHMFSETAAHSRFGWSAGEPAQRFAELIRAAVTPRMQAALMDTLRNADVTTLLPLVRVPTLIMQRKERGIDVAERMAAGIPDAKTALFEGGSAAPYLADADDVWREIATFLGEPTPVSKPSGPRTVDVRTILFTDIASSTALTQRIGDARAQELVRAHNSIVRDALRAHVGTEIKHTGDGIMASFSSVSAALECAIAIEQGIAEHGNPDLQVTIGLNAGEPVAEDSDLFGTAVQLARRLCEQALPGQILASNVVRELAAGKGFAFSDCGAVQLKGFGDAVRSYEVQWRV